MNEFIAVIFYLNMAGQMSAPPVYSNKTMGLEECKEAVMKRIEEEKQVAERVHGRCVDVTIFNQSMKSAPTI